MPHRAAYGLRRLSRPMVAGRSGQPSRDQRSRRRSSDRQAATRHDVRALTEEVRALRARLEELSQPSP